MIRNKLCGNVGIRLAKTWGWTTTRAWRSWVFVPSAVGDTLTFLGACIHRDGRGWRAAHDQTLHELSRQQADRASRDRSEQRSLERCDETKKPLEASCGPLWGVLPKMWERFATEKRWAKQLLEEAAKAAQLETDSSWQHESPLKEELELLRMGSDLRLEGSLMRQAAEHRAS